MTAGRPAPVLFAAPSLTDEDVDAVVDVLRSGWLTTGRVAQAFEQALAEEVGLDHVVATSSCTTALECAVEALRLPAGSRIALPAWTFVSTAAVVIRAGHVPVLVDADPATLNMAPESLARALDGHLDAVLPVHFAGAPVDPAVFALAADARLPVVEDGAHALGAQMDPDRVSVATCYSFYATKNLTTAEGGALATNDPDIADFARSYRLHGMSHDAWRRYEPGAALTYDIQRLGTKGNLPDVLAALGLSQLRRFSQMQERRSAVVARYRSRLAPPGSDVTLLRQGMGSAHHLFVVALPAGVDRDAVARRLGAHGIGVSAHFRPVHHFRAVAERSDRADALPVCEQMWPRVLSLPLHAGMTAADADHVVDVLDEVLVSERSAAAS